MADPKMIQCAWCRTVKDNQGDYTIPMDTLINEASHGICGPCGEAWLEDRKAA